MPGPTFAAGSSTCHNEATSRLLERDLDSMEVMTITGHSIADMLGHYTTHPPAADLSMKLGCQTRTIPWLAAEL